MAGCPQKSEAQKKTKAQGYHNHTSRQQNSAKWTFISRVGLTWIRKNLHLAFESKELTLLCLTCEGSTSTPSKCRCMTSVEIPLCFFVFGHSLLSHQLPGCILVKPFGVVFRLAVHLWFLGENVAQFVSLYRTMVYLIMHSEQKE